MSIDHLSPTANGVSVWSINIEFFLCSCHQHINACCPFFRIFVNIDPGGIDRSAFHVPWIFHMGYNVVCLWRIGICAEQLRDYLSNAFVFIFMSKHLSSLILSYDVPLLVSRFGF